MNKVEFIQKLSLELLGLPQEDVERWLEYYTEMLEDRIEDGMSEAAAVASLGDPKTIARQILAQTPLTKLIKNKIKPKRKLQVWEIVLIVLGSPIWLSLLIAAVLVKLYRNSFVMPNIIADKKVYEEFLQHQVCPKNLVPALERILPGGSERNRVEGDMLLVRQLLGDDGSARRSASSRAADAVWQTIYEKQS